MVFFRMIFALALFFSAAPRASFSDTTSAAQAGVYDVKSFGAKGDGKALDTAAINKAIDTATAAGGGTVYFPAGNYLSVSIHLKSNIALYPEFQAYFRKHKPPFLAAWGKNDPFFLPPGAEAFKRDIPDADVRFFDTGHFALETHCDEIAAAIRNFLLRSK